MQFIIGYHFGGQVDQGVERGVKKKENILRMQAFSHFIAQTAQGG